MARQLSKCRRSVPLLGRHFVAVPALKFVHNFKGTPKTWALQKRLSSLRTTHTHTHTHTLMTFLCTLAATRQCHTRTLVFV